MVDFEQIVTTYQKPILKYCYSVLCDYHEAQDAMQMTFIKAHDKSSTFKDGMPLSPWLYKIAYNTCIDIMRKKRFYSLLSGREAVTEPSCEMQEEYMSEELKKALMVLSFKDRALVFSRVIDELDYNELAQIYGASAAALRKRYERAKNKLAIALEKERSGQ
ncbi:MAG: sigma-70 family RNA polymerase sigma factor [Defluviitaleaceae bacterium]|nr:sigma-70 family RNA polymerase sigma factor [Defluviitaleaceae bacterium]